MGLPLKPVWEFQSVLNGAYKQERIIIPVLEHLPWMLICFQAKFKVNSMDFRMRNSLGPGYLVDLLFPHAPALLLRSANESFLRVPPQSEVGLNGYV